MTHPPKNSTSPTDKTIQGFLADMPNAADSTDKNTKDQAIAAAIKAFENKNLEEVREKNKKNHQGKTAQDRLTNQKHLSSDRAMAAGHRAHSRKHHMSTHFSKKVLRYSMMGTPVAALIAVFVATDLPETLLSPQAETTRIQKVATPETDPHMISASDEIGAATKNEGHATGDDQAQEEALVQRNESVIETDMADQGAAPPPPAPLATDTQPASEQRAPMVKSKKTMQFSNAAPMAMVARIAAEPMPQITPPHTGETHPDFAENDVKVVVDTPVSTFSSDVDTAAYSMVRQAIMAGHMPQAGSIRVEEMINYFDYNYPTPDTAETPFQPQFTITPTPWNPQTRLMHIGVQGYEKAMAEKPPVNLVFLIDTSGSMGGQNKLPLLVQGFKMLLNTLSDQDTVSIVTYAGSSGVALEPTKIADKSTILNTLSSLTSGGGTYGSGGIQAAYQLAEKSFRKDGVNRIMLATDGDFNIGISDRDQLKSLIAEKRKTGIFLSVLGFGTNHYNDAIMQTLAQNGNGIAAHIDTLAEAQKVLVDDAAANIFPIAKDVKIQVEFNPATVAEYRLIGYETRALKQEDFNNDAVDAGDTGSGHSVTAIYEFTPKNANYRFLPERRYGSPAADPAITATTHDNEYAFFKLRYKHPNSDKSALITRPIGLAQEVPQLDAAPKDVQFAIAVAAFGQKLQQSKWLTAMSWDDIHTLASRAKGNDPYGYRTEFLKLVRISKSLAP
jgi:Ca-activated chloride channel family protein